MAFERRFSYYNVWWYETLQSTMQTLGPTYKQHSASIITWLCMEIFHRIIGEMNTWSFIDDNYDKIVSIIRI